MHYQCRRRRGGGVQTNATGPSNQFRYRKTLGQDLGNQVAGRYLRHRTVGISCPFTSNPFRHRKPFFFLFFSPAHDAIY